MKRVFTIVLCVVMCCPAVMRAQQPVNPMQVGVWMFNADAGLGIINDVAHVPAGFAFKLALQRGLWEADLGVVTLGMETGMALSSIVEGNQTLRYTKFNIAPRASWHHGWDTDGFDTYAGLAMGIGFLTQTDIATQPRFYGSVYIGGSYFFNDGLGVNVEFGYGTTFAQIGVIYRF
ncbi:MAG: hypothetical protein LBT48_03770 [Prevotellaceae bacterium]|jgi:hypothetical protein|nr:hypothetical protein [Prevotellaceae bacterium]